MTDDFEDPVLDDPTSGDPTSGDPTVDESLDGWLRDADPAGGLTPPAGVWDSAVEAAFDPFREVSEDLTVAPGPDPSDAEYADPADPLLDADDEPDDAEIPDDVVTDDTAVGGLGEGGLEPDAFEDGDESGQSFDLDI